jgi:SP family arabinose:H+ symporter-like MFS transporter
VALQPRKVPRVCAVGRLRSFRGWPLGSALTFWLFAALSFIGWIWVYIYVPETKGQSLEQIQLIWKGSAKG